MQDETKITRTRTSYRKNYFSVKEYESVFLCLDENANNICSIEHLNNRTVDVRISIKFYLKKPCEANCCCPVLIPLSIGEYNLTESLYVSSP